MSPTPPASPAGDRPTVFISYSHRDEEWKDHVVKHLKVVLEPESVLEPWDDRNIAAGDDWRTQIEAAMARAAVAVLLISKDSLVSPFIKETEVPYLLQRRDKEGIRIIPLIVHACGWRGRARNRPRFSQFRDLNPSSPSPTSPREVRWLEGRVAGE